jgi:hypothetical protein
MGADRGLERAQAQVLMLRWAAASCSDPRQLYGSASAGLGPELAAAGHIHVAHGRIREPLSEGALDALAASWRRQIAGTFGRTSAGGLTKFEPTDMERLLVPDLQALNERERPTER